MTSTESIGSGLSIVQSRESKGDYSTEDEMDDDAVLLKRPKAD